MTIGQALLFIAISTAISVGLIAGLTFVALAIRRAIIARATRPALPSGLTTEQEDQLRTHAARAAADAIKDVLARYGSTPQTVGLAAEGVFAAVASLAWHNRADRKMRPRTLAAALARMAREQVETVAR